MGRSYFPRKPLAQPPSPLTWTSGMAFSLLSWGLIVPSGLFSVLVRLMFYSPIFFVIFTFP